MKVNIGDGVNVKAFVVDYNEGCRIVKVRIQGLAEDNLTPTEKYIRVKYEDLQ